MAPKRFGRRTPKRWGLSLFAAPALTLLIVAFFAPPTVAASSDQPGHGLLQVSTEPELASPISIDGDARNTGAVDGIELDTGEHEVCFSPVEGYLPPPCQSVLVEEGETTVVVGRFAEAGVISVLAEAGGAAPMISVDDIERDRGSTTITVPVGPHTVCASAVTGLATPDCETVQVEHRATALVTLAYAPVDEGEGASAPESEQGADAGAASPTGPNLLSSELVDMTASRSAWSPQGNVTVASDSSTAAVGTRSLRIDVDRSGPYQDATRTARAGTPQFKKGIRVDAGGEYLGFLRVRAGETPANARCEVRFYRSNGSILATLGGELTPTVRGEWVPLTCSATAPAGTSTAALRVFIDDVGYGAVFHVDDAWLGATESVSADEPAPELDVASEPEADVEPGSDGSSTDAGSVTPESWQAAWDSGDETALRAWYRANTGIAAAGLTDENLVASGSISTTHDGQIIEGLLVKGQISVRHDDVTIRDTKVVNAGDVRAIDVPWVALGDVHSLTVENVSLIGTGGASKYVQALAATYIANNPPPGAVGVQASRVYISGFGGGFRLSSTVGDRVEYSMVENIRTHSGSHNTGTSFNGGHGKVMYRNWVEGSTSSALSLYPDQRPITAFTARENVFDGGTYSILAGEGKPFSSGNHTLRYLGNRFTPSHQYGPVALYNSRQTGNEWSGNAYLDGEPID